MKCKDIQIKLALIALRSVIATSKERLDSPICLSRRYGMNDVVYIRKTPYLRGERSV